MPTTLSSTRHSLFRGLKILLGMALVGGAAYLVADRLVTRELALALTYGTGAGTCSVLESLTDRRGRIGWRWRLIIGLAVAASTSMLALAFLRS